MKSNSIWAQKRWFSVSSFQFNAVYSAAVLVIYNPLFFKKFYEVSPSGLFFAAGLLCLFLLLNAACNILLFRPVTKFLAVLLLLVNSVVYYFMITYNIAVDKVMLLNLLETDVNEARETFSYSIFWYVALLGVLPSAVVYKTEIRSRGWVGELVQRLFTIAVSLLIVAGVVFSGFKTTAQFMRYFGCLRSIILGRWFRWLK